MAVLALFETGGEDRQRGRQGHGSAHTLGEARADEHAGTGGQSSYEGRAADDQDPGHEDPAPSQQVGGSPAEEHEASVGEQVAAKYPLEALHREVKRVLDRGKGDVHDRRVHEVHEGDGAQKDEGELPSAS